MKKKVIVAGHTCLDLTPIFPRNISAQALGEVLSPGKLIHMKGVDIHTGGAVSNTGLAMKLLGADVSLMGKIGRDAFGGIIEQIYREYGAAEGLICEEGGHTSYTAVIAVPGIDRVFLHDPGCNDTFSSEDIPEEKLEGVSLFHFGYPPIMRRMYENDGEEVLKILKRMKDRKIATSMDMAFVDEDSPAGSADWKKILERILPYVDFFVPSIEELCWMLDRERFQNWTRRAGGEELVSVLRPEEDIAPLAKECLKLGAKVVLLKCGAPGLYYRTAGAEKLQELSETIGLSVEDWADRSGFEASYIPEKVLSGTGAGDTTIAAFLAAVLEGYDFEMCVHLAAAEGASCVEAYDALGGIKPLAELEKKIRGGWEKRK